MTKREPSLLLPVFLLLSLSACKATGESGAESTSDWLLPSPILAQQIQDEAARLPWTHGFERLEQIRWFALVGEPVYDTLLTLAEDPRDDVASAALAALGDTQDRRLVPYIHRLSWEESRLTGDLGLERARTLLRLGDWSEIPTLIRGLKDERQFTRSLCIQALQGATGETFGFDPKADLTDRVRAIDSWEVWWRARTGEGLLGKNG
jgi:HEAT repeat protein